MTSLAARTGPTRSRSLHAKLKYAGAKGGLGRQGVGAREERVKGGVALLQLTCEVDVLAQHAAAEAVVKALLQNAVLELVLCAVKEKALALVLRGKPQTHGPVRPELDGPDDGIGAYSAPSARRVSSGSGARRRLHGGWEANRSSCDALHAP